MADWLMEIAERKRRSELEDKNARPAQWEGRTRAELIYGRTFNDEEPRWPENPRPIPWEPLADGSLTVTLLESSSPAAPSAPPAAKPSENNATTTSSSDSSGASASANKPSPTPRMDAKDVPVTQAVAGSKSAKPPFDIEKTVDYLNEHATSKSQGVCAKAVRKALIHGGINLPEHPVSAKDYGDYLEWAGLDKVDELEYEPRKGDVAVLQPPNGVGDGHIQVYNGDRWMSDFRQNMEWFTPGPGYRRKPVEFEIFRP